MVTIRERPGAGRPSGAPEPVRVLFLPGQVVDVGWEGPVDIKGRLVAVPGRVHFAQVYDASAGASFADFLAYLDRAFPKASGKGATDTFRALDHRVPRPGDAAPPDADRLCTWVEALHAPFRIADCPPWKIADSLEWINTNLAGAAQDAGLDAEAVCRAYALLLTCDDYRLARSMTPNASMTLQAMLLRAVAPGLDRVWRERSWRANTVALRMLAAAPPSALADALELATFAGITWFARLPSTPGGLVDRDDPTESGGSEPGHTGPGGLGLVTRGVARWGHDDRPTLLAALDAATTFTFVLDDSGEAVFDLQVVQLALRAYPRLRVTVTARRWPDGRNITTAEVLHLLRTRHFADLDAMRAQGRLRVLTVAQPFPSLEPDLLEPPVRRALDLADVLLVKGASFFETVLLDREVFYAFVVHGASSAALTGHPVDHAVLYRVGAGQRPYPRTVTMAAPAGGPANDRRPS